MNARIEALQAELAATREELERVRADEQRYRTLVEHAADGLVVHDDTGRFLEANERAASVLGRRGTSAPAPTARPGSSREDSASGFFTGSRRWAELEPLVARLAEHASAPSSPFPERARMATAALDRTFGGAAAIGRALAGPDSVQRLHGLALVATRGAHHSAGH